MRAVSASSNKMTKPGKQAIKGANKSQANNNINLLPIVEDDVDGQQVQKKLVEKNATDSQVLDAGVNNDNLFGKN